MSARVVATIVLLALFVACRRPDESGSSLIDLEASMSRFSAVKTRVGELSGRASALTPTTELKAEIGPEDPALADGSRCDTWVIVGHANELVSVTATSGKSLPLRILLISEQPGLRTPLAEERSQESAAVLHAELPRDGRYLLLVASEKPREYGKYSLKLEVEPFQGMGQGNKTSNRFALLVGVEDYAGTSLDIRGPSGDVELFQRLLIEKYGFSAENILVLRDHRATRHRLIRAMREHLGQAGPDGVGVLFYSGHGLHLDKNYGVVAPRDPEPDNADEALLLADGGLLLDDEIGQLLGQLSAKRLLVVLDSCFSGTGSRNSSDGNAPFMKGVSWKSVESMVVLPDELLVPVDGPKGASSKFAGELEFATGPRGHILLAASSDQQQSWTLRTPPDKSFSGTASVFTYYLTRVVRQGDATLTFVDALAESEVETQAYVGGEFREMQTPQLEGEEGFAQIGKFLAEHPAQGKIVVSPSPRTITNPVGSSASTIHR